MAEIRLKKKKNLLREVLPAGVPAEGTKKKKKNVQAANGMEDAGNNSCTGFLASAHESRVDGLTQKQKKGEIKIQSTEGSSSTRKLGREPSLMVLQKNGADSSVNFSGKGKMQASQRKGGVNSSGQRAGLDLDSDMVDGQEGAGGIPPEGLKKCTKRAFLAAGSRDSGEKKKKKKKPNLHTNDCAGSWTTSTDLPWRVATDRIKGRIMVATRCDSRACFTYTLSCHRKHSAKG